MRSDRSENINSSDLYLPVYPISSDLSDLILSGIINICSVNIKNTNESMEEEGSLGSSVSFLA